MASSFHARPRVSARSKVFPLGTGTFPELHWRELDQKKRGGGPGQAASMSSAVTDGPDPVGEGPDVCVSVLIITSGAGKFHFLLVQSAGLSVGTKGAY